MTDVISRLIAVLMMILLVMAVLYSCQDLQYVKGDKQEVVTINGGGRNEDYLELFKRHGSPQPAVMAEAVKVVKPENRPVIAAMAIVESRGNPHAVGDGKKSRGAWQVQKRFWGNVPASATEQALQAERILEELLETRTTAAALAAYNGGNKPPKQATAYAMQVLAVAREVEQ